MNLTLTARDGEMHTVLLMQFSIMEHELTGRIGAHFIIGFIPLG